MCNPNPKLEIGFKISVLNIGYRNKNCPKGFGQKSPIRGNDS